MKDARNKKFACWVELNCGDIWGPYPTCVIDEGKKDDCVHADEISRKEQCSFWRENDYDYSKHE